MSHSGFDRWMFFPLFDAFQRMSHWENSQLHAAPDPVIPDPVVDRMINTLLWPHTRLLQGAALGISLLEQSLVREREILSVFFTEFSRYSQKLIELTHYMQQECVTKKSIHPFTIDPFYKEVARVPNETGCHR